MSRANFTYATGLHGSRWFLLSNPVTHESWARDGCSASCSGPLQVMLSATKDAQLSQGELRMGKLFLSWVIFDKMVRSRAYAILIYRPLGVYIIGRSEDFAILVFSGSRSIDTINAVFIL